MHNLNDTYVLNIGNASLHDWSRLNNVKLPCLDLSYPRGRVLVRAPGPPDGVMMTQSGISDLESVLSGESAFGLKVRICMKRSRSVNTDGTKVRPRQIRSETGGFQNGEVFQFICRNAGLKVGKPLAGFHPDVRVIRGFEIHGIECLNTFVVTGTFKVDVKNSGAVERFVKSYNEGIGSRRTYGCGLMIITA